MAQPNTQKRRGKVQEETAAQETPVQTTEIESEFAFTDGTRVKGKNYADALAKRNKMIASAPSSKSE